MQTSTGIQTVRPSFNATTSDSAITSASVVNSAGGECLKTGGNMAIPEIGLYGVPTVPRAAPLTPYVPGALAGADTLSLIALGADLANIATELGEIRTALANVGVTQ